MPTPNPDAARFLANRRSRPAKMFTAPTPTRDQLRIILTAATRVPDHGKLFPWRFVVVENRSAFADSLLEIYLAGKPDAGKGKGKDKGRGG